MGFGFLGISLLWGIYNAYIPVFLQAGRQDYSTSAGVAGFGLNPTTTGFIMTLDNIAALFILPWIGIISDKLKTKWGKRKPFIAVGAPVAAMGFVIIPFLSSVSLMGFMGAIMLTLFAMDIFRTPTISLMPDITPSKQRSQANGIINLMGGIGGVLAFLIGGYLFKISVNAPFIFGGIIMVAACGMVLFFIKEPTESKGIANQSDNKFTKSKIQFTKNKSLYFLLAGIFFWFLGYNALEVFFTSFAINEFNLDSGEATLLLANFSLAIILFSIPAGFIGGRFGRKRTIMIGIIIFAGLLFSALTLTTIFQIKILLATCGIAWSLILVNALPMVVDMTTNEKLGTYTGLYYLSSQMSAIAGPIIGGKIISIFSNDYRVLFMYSGITLICAWVVMIPVSGGEAE